MSNSWAFYNAVRDAVRRMAEAERYDEPTEAADTDRPDRRPPASTRR